MFEERRELKLTSDTRHVSTQFSAERSINRDVSGRNLKKILKKINKIQFSAFA